MPRLVAASLSRQEFEDLKGRPGVYLDDSSKVVVKVQNPVHSESAKSPQKKVTTKKSSGEDGDMNEHEENESGRTKNADFKISHGLTSAEAAELLIKYGRNELEEVVIPKWYIFVSQLWQVQKKYTVFFSHFEGF